MNKYFIFKKVREVNAETVSKGLINESPQHGDESKQMVSALDTDVPKIRKKKGKIRIKPPAKEHTVQLPPDETNVLVKDTPALTTQPPGNIVKIKKVKKKRRKVVIVDDT